MAVSVDAHREVDQLEGVPLPQEQTALCGHDIAAETLHDAYLSGRMHHAWLISGPKGIGKATLAFRLARFALSHPIASEAPQRHAEALTPISDKAMGAIAQNAHPNILHLKRHFMADKDRFAADLTVEQIRKLHSFYGQTAGSAGLRITIVDAADDMNTSAANALLKMLEEPPRQSLFIVLSHVPGRLLPTIRSRCRKLPLRPLAPHELLAALQSLGLSVDPEEMGLLFKLSEGSVRKAIELIEADGLKLHAAFRALLVELPRMDRGRLHGLVDQTLGKDSEGRYELLIDFARGWLSEQVRARPADPWGLKPFADAWARLEQLVSIADAYNLDRKQAMFDLMTTLAETARP